MSGLACFRRDTRGASAAEFALVLPAVLLMLFGIIDAGRYAWTLNQIEKAVQMGTRYAVVTQIVPDGLNTANFAGLSCGSYNVATGKAICREALGTISCTKPTNTVTCSCTQTALGAGSCPTLGTPNSSAFTNIVSRMQVFAPYLSAKDVTVKYSGSGIGFAGDPSTSTNDDTKQLADVAPIVTVEVGNMQLDAIMLFGGNVSLPRFSYSLTLEDGDGAVGY